MTNLKQKTIWGGGAALLLALISILFFDQKIALYFNQPELSAFRDFCHRITDIAEGSYYIVLALVVYLSSRTWLPFAMKKKPELLKEIRTKSGFSLLAFIVIGIVIHLLKFSFGRQRPHMTPEFESWHFAPLNFHWHWHSFPSGHAQVIFVAATLAAIFWPRLRFGFFTFAVCIAFTRVVIQQHFLGDIIFGAAIGYFGTLWLAALLTAKGARLVR